MGRDVRVIEPDGFYHVTSRGNDRRAIVRDDVDRRNFVALLDRIVRTRSLICFAYCLMTNHYHLVVRVPQANLSDAIQALNGDFSRTTNRRHGRSGHRFQNRFFSKHIVTDSQLLATCSYVVWNPVRADICTHPREWRWSSYRASAGIEFPDPIIVSDELLLQFSDEPEAARRQYRAFVDAAPTPVSDTEEEV
jgi:putative transposase